MPRTWIVLAIVYAAFFSWYTSFERPFTPEEVETLLERMAEHSPDEDLTAIRRFLETDTGDDFVMVNLIDSPAKPKLIPGVSPDATTAEVAARYMEHMWPELLKRACHPVMVGFATAPAMDIWGIEGAEDWTTVGLMRYRSRRDLVEIAVNPAFQGPHEFKIASMTKTIAFPIDPWFQLGDPRFVLALVFVAIGALVGRRNPPR